MNKRSEHEFRQLVCSDPEIGEMFPRYLKRRVTADEAELIEMHLLDCEVRQRELRFLAALQSRGENSATA